MNKQTQFAWEYRLERISKADSLDSLDCLHDFCRGFLFALLSAQVVSESEFHSLADRMNSAVVEARGRICRAVIDSVADLLVGVDNEEPEQLSISAASSELRLFGLLCVEASKKADQCPSRTLFKVSSSWTPLPGKRSLVGRESQVCLPSFKQSSA